MSHALAAPPNFSWVEPHKLAGLACPSETQHYKFLVENGIRHLVCLLEYKAAKCGTCPELILHHISIVDFTPPSLRQILRFLSIVEEANAKGEVREERFHRNKAYCFGSTKCLQVRRQVLFFIFLLNITFTGDTFKAKKYIQNQKTKLQIPKQ